MPIDLKQAVMTKDMISYGLLTAVARGIQFLMLPLLTRLFSPADYGLIELMANLTGFVVIFTSMSLESAVARLWHETQDHTHRKRLLTSVIALVSTIGIILYCIFLIVYREINFLSNLGSILSPVVATAILLSVSSIPQMVLRMERSIYKFCILQIANATLSIIFSLILIFYLEMGIVGIFFGSLISSFFVMLISIFWTRQYLSISISLLEMRDCLKYSLPLVPAVLLGWSNSQVDKIIILKEYDIDFIGVYGAAAKIAFIIIAFVEVFRLAWTPIAFSHINRSTQNSFFRNSLIGYLSIMVSVGLMLTAYSKELLSMLTTEEYTKGYIAIPWLIGAQICIGSATVTGIGMMISKKTVGNSIAGLLSMVINILLCSVFIRDFGLAGAATSTFTAAIVYTSFMLWDSMRQVEIPFALQHAVEMLLLYITTSTALILVYEYISNYSLLLRSLIVIFIIIIIFKNSLLSIIQEKEKNQL